MLQIVRIHRVPVLGLVTLIKGTRVSRIERTEHKQPGTISGKDTYLPLRLGKRFPLLGDRLRVNCKRLLVGNVTAQLDLAANIPRKPEQE